MSDDKKEKPNVRNFDGLSKEFMKKLDIEEGTPQAQGFTEMLRCICGAALGWAMDELTTAIEVPEEGTVPDDVKKTIREDPELGMAAVIVATKGRAITAIQLLAKSILFGQPKKDLNEALEEFIEESELVDALKNKKVYH